jgi:DNA polymerase
MSLDLDKRQRAMLSEMGIKLWQPASAKDAKGAEPVQAHAVPEAEPQVARMQAAQAVAKAAAAPKTRPAALAAVAASTPAKPLAQDDSDANVGPAWQLGQPQPVYSTSAPGEQTSAIRWLVLAELPAGAAQALDGEAGQLLDNMLRAAGMHRDAALQFVPVQRGRGAEPAAESQNLQDQLAALIQVHQPSAVLVMGRLAAQALLPSAEPFAKRRGQPLSLAGCPLLLTYDTTYLLRNLPEKARAWEDLCLARVMTARPEVS